MPQELNLDGVIKVRVPNIIETAGSLDKKTWWKRFRFIAQKYVDFVLIDIHSRPAIAFELSDKSHGQSDPQKLLLDVFTDAYIPLLFIQVANEYDIYVIRKMIDRSLKEFEIV